MKIPILAFAVCLMNACGAQDTPKTCTLKFEYESTRTDERYTTVVYRAATKPCVSFFANNSGAARIELSSLGKALRVRTFGFAGPLQNIGETITEVQLPVEQTAPITLELDFLPMSPTSDIPAGPTASAAVIGLRG